jgi:hypothetical protein
MLFGKVGWFIVGGWSWITSLIISLLVGVIFILFIYAAHQMFVTWTRICFWSLLIRLWSWLFSGWFCCSFLFSKSSFFRLSIKHFSISKLFLLLIVIQVDLFFVLHVLWIFFESVYQLHQQLLFFPHYIIILLFLLQLLLSIHLHINKQILPHILILLKFEFLFIFPFLIFNLINFLLGTLYLHFHIL